MVLKMQTNTSTTLQQTRNFNTYYICNVRVKKKHTSAKCLKNLRGRNAKQHEESEKHAYTGLPLSLIPMKFKEILREKG